MTRASHKLFPFFGFEIWGLTPYISPNSKLRFVWVIAMVYHNRAEFPVFYHCRQIHYPLPTSDFPASSIPNVKVTSTESIIAIKAGVSRATGKVPFTNEVWTEKYLVTPVLEEAISHVKFRECGTQTYQENNKSDRYCCASEWNNVWMELECNAMWISNGCGGK